MKQLHFVGIGGARLSALAKLFQDRGFAISGSDHEETSVTRALAARGIVIFLGHDPVHVNGVDRVVYTNAVGEENPEVVAARSKGIPVTEGATLLGELMAEIGTGIAIAGTHGKTTTTAMTALVLTTAGLDPTVLIGGQMPAFGGNHRTGDSQYMVVEACEFRHSFLALKPRFELITNIDWDHPDCFPDLDAVITAFRDFIQLLPEDGRLAVWGDDPNALRLGREFDGKLITFGYQPDFDWSVQAVEPFEPLGIRADLLYKGKRQAELRLQVPGRHNLQNAMGALAIALELGADLHTALQVLADFRGVQRRFEIKGNYHDALIVDDYAHHPSAIQMSLRAARQAFKGRIWCVFQPHLYSRTRHLLAEFASAFTDTDILLLADIYPAREKDPGDISSAILAEKVAQHHPDVRYLGGFAEIEEHLRRNISAGDLVITMGAGDIYRIGESLVSG